MATDALTYFRDKANSYASPSTRDNYLKFVASLERFLAGSPLTFEGITPQFTAAWRDSLVERGSTASYINRLAQNFRSLTRAASKEGHLSYNPESFGWVTSARPAAATVRRSGSAIDLLRRISTFTRHTHTPFAEAASLILLGVTTGLSLDTLSHLTQNDFDGETLQIGDETLYLPLLASVAIAAMQPVVAQPDGPLLDALATGVADTPYRRIAALLSYLGHPVADDSCQSIADHLIALTESALAELHEAAVDIHAYLPRIPQDLRVKYHGERPALPMYCRTEMGEKLAKAIDDVTPYWYVVNISHSDYDTVRDLLTSNAEGEGGGQEDAEVPELYYPMEALTKSVGNKIKHMESPVIRNIMFVRSDRHRIAAIAARLHPAAYVMRTGRTPGAPYARVQPRDFNRFRLIVSHGKDFAECDAEVRDLAPDTRVRITDDLYAGYTGIIIRRRDPNTYDVSLLGTSFSLFAVSLPSQFLQPE